MNAGRTPYWPGMAYPIFFGFVHDRRDIDIKRNVKRNSITYTKYTILCLFCTKFFTRWMTMSCTILLDIHVFVLFRMVTVVNARSTIIIVCSAQITSKYPVCLVESFL